MKDNELFHIDFNSKPTTCDEYRVKAMSIRIDYLLINIHLKGEIRFFLEDLFDKSKDKPYNLKRWLLRITKGVTS